MTRQLQQLKSLTSLPEVFRDIGLKAENIYRQYLTINGSNTNYEEKLANFKSDLLHQQLLAEFKQMCLDLLRLDLKHYHLIVALCHCRPTYDIVHTLRSQIIDSLNEEISGEGGSEWVMVNESNGFYTPQERLNFLVVIWSLPLPDGDFFSMPYYLENLSRHGKTEAEIARTQEVCNELLWQVFESDEQIEYFEANTEQLRTVITSLVHLPYFNALIFKILARIPAANIGPASEIFNEYGNIPFRPDTIRAKNTIDDDEVKAADGANQELLLKQEKFYIERYLFFLACMLGNVELAIAEFKKLVATQDEWLIVGQTQLAIVAAMRHEEPEYDLVLAMANSEVIGNDFKQYLGKIWATEKPLREPLFIYYQPNDDEENKELDQINYPKSLALIELFNSTSPHHLVNIEAIGSLEVFKGLYNNDLCDKVLAEIANDYPIDKQLLEVFDFNFYASRISDFLEYIVTWASPDLKIHINDQIKPLLDRARSIHQSSTPLTLAAREDFETIIRIIDLLASKLPDLKQRIEIDDPPPRDFDLRALPWDKGKSLSKLNQISENIAILKAKAQEILHRLRQRDGIEVPVATAKKRTDTASTTDLSTQSSEETPIAINNNLDANIDQQIQQANQRLGEHPKLMLDCVGLNRCQEYVEGLTERFSKKIFLELFQSSHPTLTPDNSLKFLQTVFLLATFKVGMAADSGQYLHLLQGQAQPTLDHPSIDETTLVQMVSFYQLRLEYLKTLFGSNDQLTTTVRECAKLIAYQLPLFHQNTSLRIKNSDKEVAEDYVPLIPRHAAIILAILLSQQLQIMPDDVSTTKAKKIFAIVLSMIISPEFVLEFGDDATYQLQQEPRSSIGTDTEEEAKAIA